MALTDNGKFTPSDRFVSPGVYTREIDDSGLAQGIASIGGVVVAPFPKGPGFSPTLVRSQADLERIFGEPDGTLYGPYTAQQYLSEQGQVTIVRVGGLAGYKQSDALFITAVPGQYSRYNVSSNFVGKLIGATYSKNEDTDVFSVDGTLSVTFTNGIYSGSTMVVGDIAGVVIASDWTGSVLKQGTLQLGLENSSLPHNPADQIDVTATFNVNAVNACKSEFVLVGSIVGAYGDFDVSTWTAGNISVEDICGGVTSSLGRDEVVLAVLANTAHDIGQNLYGFSGSVLSLQNEATLSADYKLRLKETYYDDTTGDYVSSTYGTYKFSLDSENSSYITNVFGKDPKAGYVAVANGQKIEAAYTYVNFDNKIKQVVEEMLTSGSWKITATTRDAMTFEDGITPDVGTSQYDLRQAETPWIVSQKISSFGTDDAEDSYSSYELFKVHTMGDGTNTNTEFKVEIANVKSPGSIAGTDFGSFSLILRDFNDTDTRPKILERYDNLTLNPTSSNYIARIIGDTYNYIDYNGKIMEFGNYPNISKRIRVEMSTAPIPVKSIPYGFNAYASPIGGDYARLGKLPAMVYCSGSAYTKNPGRYASGVCFNPAPGGADEELMALYPNGSSVGPEVDNRQYFAPVPVGASTKGNVGFGLESVGVTPLYIPSEESTNVKKRRFVLGFQGGFDGMSPSVPVLVGDDIISTNQQGFDCATNKSNGSYGYKQCLAALSNADEWDFNLLVTPGVNYQYHPYVAKLALDICEARADAFYIMDIAPNQAAGDSSIENVISLASEFDSSYGAVYYPWIKIKDTNSNKIITVPPSVVMMGVYAANDNVQAEWFAPAGFNRGGIPQAIQVMDRLTQTNRDDLCEGRVNPIGSFPGIGIAVLGQNTLQRNASALSKVNVRRLLIAVKKHIASASKFLLFEQNTTQTRNKFLAMVNPYLESIQQRQGLYAFRVEMNDGNNPADLVDRGILYGKIKLQPTRAIEMIALDFGISSTGATFSE